MPIERVLIIKLYLSIYLIGFRLVTKEEKFHLLVATTGLVTVHERNIDTYYLIREPGEIYHLVIYHLVICLLLIFREDLLLVVYIKGHRVEAPVTHNKDSSLNRYIELIVLLPEI